MAANREWPLVCVYVCGSVYVRMYASLDCYRRPLTRGRRPQIPIILRETIRTTTTTAARRNSICDRGEKQQVARREASGSNWSSAHCFPECLHALLRHCPPRRRRRRRRGRERERLASFDFSFSGAPALTLTPRARNTFLFGKTRERLFRTRESIHTSLSRLLVDAPSSVIPPREAATFSGRPSALSLSLRPVETHRESIYNNNKKKKRKKNGHKGTHPDSRRCNRSSRHVPPFGPCRRCTNINHTQQTRKSYATIPLQNSQPIYI